MPDLFAPRTTPRSQPGIKSALATKEQKDVADLAVGRFWFDANLPFNAARSKFCQPMADAIAAVGPGYKMPSYHDLRGKILGKIVVVINDFMEHYRLCWNKTWCPIMEWLMGGQMKRQRTLILPKGVDTSAITKNADSLFKVFDEIVLLVGPDNIVQFITDNDATYKAAGKGVAEKYGTFYWTACAAHCIDLMLEDMAKPDLFPVNASTRKVTKFIYNHLSVLNLMRREYTHGRELIRPAITRFATNFISLQCLYQFRKELQQMFTSTAWEQCNVSSTMLKNVEHLLKVGEVLVGVLHLADSEDKPAMDYVYEAMDRAKEVIQKRLKNKNYMPYWKIDRRWDNQLHSALHATACLNPAFFLAVHFLSTAKSSGVKIMSSRNYFLTQDMIFKQCDDYKDSHFDFDKWWDRFGNGTPELKEFAVRILSQCIRASGCERNWSIFKHIHSPRRNRLEHQRLHDLVFVHYNLKLHERDMLKRTGNATSNPISIENINILADWVAKEAPFLTMEDVNG
ncbi:hypothetical protein CKAN_00118600 [Cinnamomum micranthum f. kanehirae]|uniref:DUF659 domain-containing protein n=1 Tax=Cinnamomum micranthum f. kanehirae TaxID=337451 RepID=A0A443N329_9MAGN|nr:hypothetical protein CKAN_00118600 [Cinnamomum micranthum f. kanehirae]